MLLSSSITKSLAETLVKKEFMSEVISDNKSLSLKLLLLESGSLGFYIFLLALCSFTRVKNVDDLSITEFAGKNLYCILKHILYITEYLAYFSYFIIFSIIVHKNIIYIINLSICDFSNNNFF